MKRLIVIVALSLLSFGAWAQYSGDVVERSGRYLKVNGEKLSPEAQRALLANVGGVDCNAVWDAASAGKRLGTGLTVGGGLLTAGGLASVLVGLVGDIAGAAVGGIIGSIGGQEGAQQGAEEGAKAGNGFVTGGLIASAAGLGTMAFGISRIVSNARKLNEIVDTCNNGRPSAQLTLGPTPGGVGLVLYF